MEDQGITAEPLMEQLQGDFRALAEKIAATMIIHCAGGTFKIMGRPMKRATRPGTYTLEAETTDAVGRWRLRVSGGQGRGMSPLGPVLLSSALMMLVAAASVGFWRWRSRAGWRWFAIGAALWAVAVAVKFAMTIPLSLVLEEKGVRNLFAGESLPPASRIGPAINSRGRTAKKGS